jgi:NAD-specific glutamate dehydrogenase
MAIMLPIYNMAKNQNMKQESFFQIKNRLKLEATDELIKEMERRHQWKKLAELVKYREELKCSKQGVAAAAGREL